MKRKTKKSRLGLHIAIPFILVLSVLVVIFIKPFDKNTGDTKNSPVKVDPSKSTLVITSHSVVVSHNTEK
jgi:hypothetical protein